MHPVACQHPVNCGEVLTGAIHQFEVSAKRIAHNQDVHAMQLTSISLHIHCDSLRHGLLAMPDSPAAQLSRQLLQL